jgi:hypothetical protein
VWVSGGRKEGGEERIIYVVLRLFLNGGGLGIEIIAVRLAQQMRFETFNYWTYFSWMTQNARLSKANLNSEWITSRLKFAGFALSN